MTRAASAPPSAGAFVSASSAPPAPPPFVDARYRPLLAHARQVLGSRRCLCIGKLLPGTPARHGDKETGKSGLPLVPMLVYAATPPLSIPSPPLPSFTHGHSQNRGACSTDNPPAHQCTTRPSYNFHPAWHALYMTDTTACLPTWRRTPIPWVTLGGKCATPSDRHISEYVSLGCCVMAAEGLDWGGDDMPGPCEAISKPWRPVPEHRRRHRFPRHPADPEGPAATTTSAKRSRARIAEITEK